MYFCSTTANAQTIANKPYNDAFSLLVERHAGIKQTFTIFHVNSPRSWVRNYYNGSWGAWREKVYRTNLYNNTSGTSGTVTLSETSANFSYIDIFFIETQGGTKQKSVRVYSPNGQTVNLEAVIKDPTQDVMFFFSSIIQISGTQITFTYKASSNMYAGSATNYSNTNSIKIVRIDGYR